MTDDDRTRRNKKLRQHKLKLEPYINDIAFENQARTTYCYHDDIQSRHNVDVVKKQSKSNRFWLFQREGSPCLSAVSSALDEDLFLEALSWGVGSETSNVIGDFSGKRPASLNFCKISKNRSSFLSDNS